MTVYRRRLLVRGVDGAMYFWRQFALCCVLLLVAGRANAAEITAIPSKQDPADVTILIVGNLAAADVDDFRRKITPYSKGLVVFRSDGGSAFAGLEIGRAIRLRSFSTWVPSGVRCASACGIAWLGGSPRAMGKNALVGFHAAYQLKDGVASESGAGNAVVGAYLGSLGLPDRAILYLTSAAPSSLNWLTPEAARNLGIELAVYDPPDGSNPQTANASSGSLEMASREFLAADYAILGGTNDGVLPWAYRIYSDQTSYFGKIRSRDDIVTDLARWLERWPRRHYVPRPMSITIDCNQTTRTCVVKGLLDFVAESPERNERSKGLATFSFTLQFDANLKVHVLQEDGRTLTRTKEAIVQTMADPLSRSILK